MMVPQDTLEVDNGTSVINGNCHFTYCEPQNNDLLQGDILEKTDELTEVLTDVHPYYSDKGDYTHFIVLTQSCDLVRRDGNRKAKYITLAVIRPLQLVIDRELTKYQGSVEKTADVCSDEHKHRIEQFLSRVFNNNESEYFYLEAEPAFGIFEASCAFLRLSIAIRASENYQTLLEARILSLSEIFKAKLGWLVGNIYSRIGTPDWVPDYISEGEFNEKIADVLDDIIQWVPRKKLKAARKDLPDVDQDRESLRKFINEYNVPSKKDEVIAAVINVLLAEGVIESDQERTIRTRLTNDPDLSTLVK